ncbi:MAG: hypothetical protein P4L76_03085 [Beijerinckiaceae bacterium]|nr:hypothetical protein [Beijerinckiaceae bacterium]
MITEITSMPRYFFHLENARPFRDVDGLELPDIDAAHDEAVGLARDIMRLEPGRRNWSKWTVSVTDGNESRVLQIPFSDVN